MQFRERMKPFTRIIYAICSIVVFILLSVSLFGSNTYLYPEAMIPYTWRNIAFFSQALLFLPASLICYVTYKVHNLSIKNQALKTVLLFLPGLICLFCFLFIVGVLVIGMLGMFM